MSKWSSKTTVADVAPEILIALKWSFTARNDSLAPNAASSALGWVVSTYD
jgi:hypothetical protein